MDEILPWNEEDIPPTPENRAIELTKTLADFIRRHPRTEWQLPFVLARKLHVLGGKPSDYRKEVELFCELTENNFLDFIAEFYFVWDTIKHPDHGEDTFTNACQFALAQPVPLPAGVEEPPHETYKFVYSLAVHLDRLSKELSVPGSTLDPIIISQPRTAEFINKHIGKITSRTVGRIILWLIKQRLMECVDRNYKFAGKKNQAMKYILTNNVH